MMNQPELDRTALAKAEGIMRKVEQGITALMRENPDLMDRLHLLAQDAAEAANLLRVQGIGMDKLPPGNPLATIDTHSAQMLRMALEDAALYASKVDEERGHTYQGQGADYAASLGVILARLRAEIEPPQGRD